jgi:hypothetical protein
MGIYTDSAARVTIIFLERLPVVPAKAATHAPCALDNAVAMGTGSRLLPLPWPG